MIGLGTMLLGLRMEAIRHTHGRRLAQSARHPRDAQARWLRRHLARNADTRFGRAHGFASVRGPADYAARVPVQDYESLRPLIDEQDRTGAPILTREMPIMYAQTSGTTGAPKLIPYLASTLASHRRSQAVQASAQFAGVPGAYAGRLLPIVSPAVEGYLPSGRPFGSASGHVFRNMPRLARAKYVVPYPVFEIEDYDLKYLTILRLAIPHRDVTLMGAANPSTFLRLLDLLARHGGELAEDIAAGRFRHRDRLPPHVARAVDTWMPTAAAGRIRELRRALASSRPTFADVWPDLSLVNTWTGGSCRIAHGQLDGAFPAGARVSELGYLASECRGTVVVDPVANLCAPVLDETYFEFAERDAWDEGRRETLTVDALEPGREYYVIVTTDGGLYRYFMNDLLTVTGRFHETPTLQFVRKGKGVTSITGEKLYEHQVIDAVQGALRAAGAATGFFVMLADEHAARYRLVVETDATGAARLDATFGARVDRGLGDGNVEYGVKRKSGRLGSIDVLAVRPGTADRYKRHCVAAGQREAQFKLLALQYAAECTFDFGACRHAPPSLRVARAS